MQKITQWIPLSCNCCYQYSWDSESTEEERIHTFYKAVNVCDIHKRPNPEESYHACLADNRTIPVENE